jgi:5-methylcytosine-specific restriction protein A
MPLRDITRTHVLAAIAEYNRLGQIEFLRRYGFDRARSYLLIHEGKSYDSKAIVGAAHGFLPGTQPLAAGQFSGGEATVGRLLRRLGFTVQVSDNLSTGEFVRQITSLTVDRSSGRPALYQPITLLWAIGRAYRGEPRMEGWDVTQRSVQELLERYGHQGARLRADYPVAALHRAGLWQLDESAGPVPNTHGDAKLRRWFDAHQPRGGLVPAAYNLVRNSGEARVAAVGAILETFLSDTDYVALLEDIGLSDTGIAAEAGDADDQSFSGSPLEEAYRRLCGIAERHMQRGSSRRVARTSDRLMRSAAARRAVLMRSTGKCENPLCTGQAQDLTDSGDPILEIDHIHDLALGGPNDPGQMIALCPNCHAVKTRGRTREQLRDLLFVTAKQRHQALVDAVHTTD